MLQTSLRSARLLSGRSLATAAGRQWPVAASRQVNLQAKRYFAGQKKPGVDPATPPVLPTSETKSSERTTADLGEPKPPTTGDVPLTPPSPLPKNAIPEAPATLDDVGQSKVLESQIPNPPPPTPPAPKKKKGFFRRLRNFVFTLMVLGVVGFSGGVWYSRINDSFHDFFTEYVPFGEQAVLYLEELEFKKRFPQTTSHPSRPRDSAEQVRIPAQSGASWRVADTTESTGRQSSASPTKKKPAKPSEEPAKTSSAKPAELNATAAAVKSAEKTTPNVEKPKVKEPKPEKPAPAPETFKAPEVNEPSKFPPLAPIDLLKQSDAREPVVQDLVHMVNDLILVINADGAHGKYGTTINKAKGEINKVGSKLKDLKSKVEKEAAQEVRSKIEEFDKASTELVNRVEQAMIAQERQWRQEYEEEMKNVRESYDERVKLLLDREEKLNNEKLQNQLLEQAIALKKEFAQEVHNHVEKERNSRLGKIEELSSAVADLEKLAVGWNSVVDTNLKTQQLHVAVEAVRANLEGATHPQPFIKELVALKEIAADDPVVNAAIASVNPSSYQRGIFTSSQLIDRFRRVASEVRKASLLPDEAGVASHASSWVLSHVMFQKKGLAQGNDVESILTRTQTFLEEGDLDAAAREMNELDGWAKTLSKDWLSEVRKVLEVQQALDVIATEARLQSLRVE